MPLSALLIAVRRLPPSLGDILVPNARERALDFLAQRYRSSPEVVPIPELRVPVYGFDSNGWDLFVVLNKNGHLTLRGDEYVAVHRTNGEVKYLGILGD